MIVLELEDMTAALVAAACLAMATDDEAPPAAVAALTGVCDEILGKLEGKQ